MTRTKVHVYTNVGSRRLSYCSIEFDAVPRVSDVLDFGRGCGMYAVTRVGYELTFVPASGSGSFIGHDEMRPFVELDVAPATSLGRQQLKRHEALPPKPSLAKDSAGAPLPIDPPPGYKTT